MKILVAFIAVFIPLFAGLCVGFSLGCTFGSIDCVKDYLADKGILYRVFIYQRYPEVYTYKYRFTLGSAIKCATQWWCKSRSVSCVPHSACVTISAKFKGKKHAEKFFELEA